MDVIYVRSDLLTESFMNLESLSNFYRKGIMIMRYSLTHSLTHSR